MHRIRTAFCALGMVVASAASAVPITFDFAGTVTDDPFGLTSFGAPISGSFTFDGAAIDSIAGPATGSYRSIGPAFEFRALVDGLLYVTHGGVVVNTANDIGVDQYGVIGTEGGLTLELFFEDATETALSSDALPTKPPSLAAFSFRQFRLFSDDAQYLGSVTSLVCTVGCTTAGVPEPAVLPLFGLAGLALLASRLRRKFVRSTYSITRRRRPQEENRMNRSMRRHLQPWFAVAVAVFSSASWAVDGVVLIDQNKALAGGVTPGDGPGYPITITQPGSYRLTGNLTVPNANTNGIEINVQNVTIDLNGFAILGPVTCSEFPTITCSGSGTGSGIVGLVFANLVVRNGFIQGMGRDGVFMLSGSVDSVQANQNARSGINVTSGTVRDSIARANGVRGIEVDFGAAIRNVLNHNPVGLSVSSTTSYNGNTFSFNTVNVQGGGVNTGQNVCDSAICPGAQF